jgi:hypothetical protein
MKDMKIASHQIDVVEIMKKIRQSAAGNRADSSHDERVKREVKSDFLTLAQSAQVPEYMVEEIRQGNLFPAYDPRTMYASSRSGVGSLIGLIRKILRPITKLFINLDPMAGELHRLTVLNNLYLKAIQDLLSKTSSLQVDLHMMKKRHGHHPRMQDDHGSRNHRRHRQPRREDNRNSQPVRTTSASESSAQ